MAQPPLVSSVIYHIYNRGNNGETIFLEEWNYEYFLQLYDKNYSRQSRIYSLTA